MSRDDEASRLHDGVAVSFFSSENPWKRAELAAGNSNASVLFPNVWTIFKGVAMKRISMAVVVLLMVAGTSMAQVSQHADWAKGPVKHLFTKEDVTAWNALKSDAEAEAFIELFWARRDPTPNTVRNEFKEEFDARVAAADEHFTTRLMRGSLSDRGRALILLGAPFQMGATGPGGRAPGMTMTGPGGGADASGVVSVAGARAETAKMVWTYSHDKKPKFIKRKDFEIMFVDEKGGGEWEFGKTARTTPEALLQEAVNFYLVSPRMMSIPTYADAVPPAPVRATAFKSAELKTAYDQFRSEKKSSVGSAYLTWGEYVTPEGVGFVPVQLYVPASAGVEAGKKVTFFGAVENEAGEIVEVYEEPVTLLASAGDVYFDKSLRLEPGNYVTTVGLVADGKTLALNRTEMKIEGLEAKTPGTSQLILSNNAFALPEAQKITDPYAFGGLKVVPKGDGIFTQKDELWYFLEMRNPGTTEEGETKVQVKIDIQGKTAGDKPVKWEFPLQEAELLALKGVEGHYGLGAAFPLTDFEPGEYTMKVRVLDTVLKKSYDFQREFKVKG
jgi:GWxTD domain-containing protein